MKKQEKQTTPLDDKDAVDSMAQAHASAEAASDSIRQPRQAPLVAEASRRVMQAPKPPAMTKGEMLTNAVKHLGTVNHHRGLVAELMFKAGLPLQGLVHDLSKYSPDEMQAGILYYQGDRSPNSAERYYKGHSEAWMHHKGRNKHHYEYWTDMRYGGDGTLYGTLIPTRYMVEMLCDRIAASKTYKKDAYNSRCPLEYFELELSYGNLPIHPDSAAFLYVLLNLVAEMGEDKALAYVKEKIVKPRYVYADGARF